MTGPITVETLDTVKPEVVSQINRARQQLRGLVYADLRLEVREAQAALALLQDREGPRRTDERELLQFLCRGPVQIQRKLNPQAGEAFLPDLLQVGLEMRPGGRGVCRVDPLDLRVAGKGIQEVRQIHGPGVVVVREVPPFFPVRGVLDRGKGRVG